MLTNKACTKCGITKPVVDFSPDKRNRNGLQSQCKSCCHKNTKSYELSNPEKIKETRKKYYNANAEQRRALSRLIRNRDVESARAKCKKWREANPHLVNALSAKRRAILCQTTPAWADQSKIQIQYFMAKFLTEISNLPHEVDHIVPLRSKVVCGLHVETNLRVILSEENRRKSNKFAQ